MSLQFPPGKIIGNSGRLPRNPELRNYMLEVRKKYDQIIDGINLDEITNLGWVKEQEAAAELTISNFTHE